VQDLAEPGVLRGRVVRPPSPGARLTAVDLERVRPLPGVAAVVRDGSFLAVAAEREEQADRAAEVLRAAARWVQTATMPPRDIHRWLRHQQAESFLVVDGVAGSDPIPPVEVPPGAATTLTATYTRPYLMHGSIGPSAAMAEWGTDELHVWSATQSVEFLRATLAEALDVRPDAIRVSHVEGAGCYGHNGADDVSLDAALLSRAVPGRRVLLRWTREDEHAWEPYGSAMITKVRAALDASGSVAGWQYDVWSNTHSTRPAGKAGELAAAWSLERPFQPSPPRAIPQPEGGGDRNAIPLYKFPARVTHHFIAEMPLRVSALRALGGYMNVFSIESFVDELAAAAKADPVEFRLRHLDDPRARDVIRFAAERFGWNAYQKQNGRGRGFAFARYKNLAAYAAIAMEVQVKRETGELRVLRVVAAVDSGDAVNPDGIRNQIEGGVLQSVSWTTFESVMCNDTRITSRDWGSYPILRFSHVPQSMEVHVIDRPGEHFLGTGEAAQGPAAGALANALAHASGVRVRELPFSPRRLRQMLSA
jgi:CO/xanthine dehydrogenase Mo-binding subunit